MNKIDRISFLELVPGMPLDTIPDAHRVLVKSVYADYTYGLFEGMWYVQSRGGWLLPQHDVSNPMSFYDKTAVLLFRAKECELFLETI